MRDLVAYFQFLIYAGVDRPGSKQLFLTAYFVAGITYAILFWLGYQYLD
jgi:hypothetical protein